MSFEQWDGFGRQLVDASEVVQWAIGDWLNFGHAQFIEAQRDEEGKIPEALKDKYKFALSLLPYDYQTLRDIAWVCHRVALSSRDDKLTFAHHRVVAPLEPKLQRKYLAIAAQSEPVMSRAELRQLIRRDLAEADDREGPKPLNEGPVLHAVKLDLWVTKQDPSQWETERREAWKRQLRPLVEFYNRL